MIFQIEINPKSSEAVAKGNRCSHILLMGVQNGTISMGPHLVKSLNIQMHSLLQN